jgi:outer membrane receptor for monomeric catechols
MAQDEPQELEAFISEEVPIEENILPTSRPFDSVFGFPQSILDTPRNVTIISREQLDAISITDVRDFTKLTSSSFTRTNFGAPATPDIRTQISDVMWNGIRRGLTSNGNGLPINFNAVESVNIVKGPASVVHGASHYVGGYVDFITKRPYFDEFRGEVAVTYGSYDKRQWTLDFGGPISDKMAYRVSYSGEDSDSYYDHSFKRTEALYGALVFRPTDKYELFVNGEVLYAHYTENFGINRPTQDLIDNGNYITGVNNNPAPDANGLLYDSDGVAIDFGNDGKVPAGDAAPMSDPQNSKWVVSGYPITNRMVWGETVKVDRSWRLIKPGDDSNGYSVNLQAIQTFTLDDESKIVSNTFFNYIKRDTFSSYQYSEIIDPSWRLESRLEYQRMGEKYDLNAGVAANYQEVTAYNHFFFEPANVWDLSLNANEFIDVYNSVHFPGAPEVPGWPGRYATEGVFNGDTSDSEAFGLGPFAQLNYRITESFSIQGGVRMDFLSVSARDPLKPVFIASADDDIDVQLLNYNISPFFKLNEMLSFYATYNYSENPGGAVANGGGFGQLEDEDDDGVYTLTKSRFEQESELIELGAKASFLDGKLFLGTAIFQQERTNLSIDGSIDKFTTKGFEIEGNYQPNRNWFFTAGWSILDSTVNGPQFDVNNTSPWLPDQTPNFILPAGEYKRQGVPRHTANALVSYKLDNGFGVQVAGFITSEMNNNVAGSLVIPTQFNIDVTFLYEADTWEASLTVLNLTDEENWSPPNAVYGGESIFAEPPIRVEGTLT